MSSTLLSPMSSTLTMLSRRTNEDICQHLIRSDYTISIPEVDELCPQWLLRPFEDEDDNKAVVADMQKRPWRYIMKRLYSRLQRPRIRAPLPYVRPFTWSMSYHVVPEGYQYGSRGQQPPWGILVRCLFVDLPSQLSRYHSRESIGSWRRYQAQKKEELINCTDLDENPFNATCGKRIIFSPQSSNSSRALGGDWLVVLYLWASDRQWVTYVNPLSLLVFSNMYK